MSALTHNIVLLNHTERPNRTRRTLAVLKLRDSGHDLSVREFAITDRGFHVVEVVEDASSGRAEQQLPRQRARSQKKRVSAPTTKGHKRRKQRA